MKVQLAALGCVLLLTGGQIAFKAAADAGVAAGGMLSPRPLLMTAGALAIYAVASLLWILLLQRAPISRIYPFMGLAFVVVPVAAHFLLGDTLGVRHLLGSVIIAVGVVIAVSA